MSKRPPFPTLMAAIFAVAGFISVSWLIADQPESHPQTDSKQVSPQMLFEREPAIPTPLADPNEALKDPLYQAIRDELNAGRPNLIAGDNQSGDPIPIDKSNSVSDSEWKAVELILRAARILEREEKLRGTQEGATDHQSTARQLRADALHILRRAISP